MVRGRCATSSSATSPRTAAGSCEAAHSSPARAGPRTVSRTSRRPSSAARPPCSGSRRRGSRRRSLPPQVVGVPVPALSARRRRAGRSLLPPAIRRAAGRRDHRHQRQDHHRLSARAGADAVGRRGAYLGTLGAGRPGPSRRRRAHDAGCRLGASAPGGSARRWRRDARDGSFLARARPGTRRRRALRHGGLHQPEPRSSRLPRDDRSLRRREDAAVPAPADCAAPSINVQDPFGRRLAETLDPGVESVWFSTVEAS